MDDEEVVRTVAEELLHELGHDVVCTEHGDAAVDAYRRAKDAGRPFDIVILDLTIRGGMGGSETMVRLRAIDPEVRAIVSSGYSDDEIVSDFRKQGFRAFLKKPYDLSALRETLAPLLV
jgi:CheY-like chemotaxis protein